MTVPRRYCLHLLVCLFAFTAAPSYGETKVAWRILQPGLELAVIDLDTALAIADNKLSSMARMSTTLGGLESTSPRSDSGRATHSCRRP